MPSTGVYLMDNVTKWTTSFALKQLFDVCVKHFFSRLHEVVNVSF